jgi:hypothetical protein
MSDITSNLLHWYKADEGTGTNLADSGSSPLAGTLTNGPTWASPAGVVFDGVDDQVNFAADAAIANLSALTIAYRAKLGSSPPDFGLYFTRFFDANNRIEIECGGSGFGNASDILGIVSRTGSIFGYTTSHPMTVGVERHVAMVFDGTQTGDANRLKIYIDGVAETLTFSGTIPAQTPNIPTTVGYLGRRQNASLPYKGTIRDVRIYDRALSAADVAAFASGRRRRLLTSGGV